MTTQEDFTLENLERDFPSFIDRVLNSIPKTENYKWYFHYEYDNNNLSHFENLMDKEKIAIYASSLEEAKVLDIILTYKYRQYDAGCFFDVIMEDLLDDMEDNPNDNIKLTFDVIKRAFIDMSRIGDYKDDTRDFYNPKLLLRIYTRENIHTEKIITED